jgi:hypothetical protein
MASVGLLLAAGGTSLACKRASEPPKAAAAAVARREAIPLAPVEGAKPPAPVDGAKPPAPVDAAPYGLRPAEKTAVAAFLREHTDLRAATDDDRRASVDSDDVASMYGIYHPYFVRGDANDDGLLDFVIAFVRRDSDDESPWFSVVVFAGDSRGGFGPGVILERDISLADGDLSMDRDTIVVTPDLSDEAARRYRWDPERGRHVFVHDAPEEPPSPPASQT